MPSRFFEQEVDAKLKHRRALSAFLDALIQGRKAAFKKIQLTYIFCNDIQLHQINQQFLNHDTLTDIITFDLSENMHALCGEIYVSTERVAENAQIFNTTYQQELHRVIFHGALHLCGLSDKTEKDKIIMRAAENETLHQWFATKR